jgi:hypothetical protein
VATFGAGGVEVGGSAAATGGTAVTGGTAAAGAVTGGWGIAAASGADIAGGSATTIASAGTEVGRRSTVLACFTPAQPAVRRQHIAIAPRAAADQCARSIIGLSGLRG